MSSAPILIRLPDVRASRKKMEQRTESEPIAQDDAIHNNTSELSHSTTKAEPVVSRRPSINKSHAASGWASAAWNLVVGILLIALFIVSYLAIAGSRPSDNPADQPKTAENKKMPGGLSSHSHELAIEPSMQLQTSAEKSGTDTPYNLDPNIPVEDIGPYQYQDKVGLPSYGSSLLDSDPEILDVNKVDLQQNVLHDQEVKDDVASSKPAAQTAKNNGYSYPVTDPTNYWYPGSSAIARGSAVPDGPRSAALPGGSGRRSDDFRPPGAATLNGTIESPTMEFRR